MKLNAIIALAQQTVAAAATAPAPESPAPSAAAESSRSGSRAMEVEEPRVRVEEVDRRKRQRRAPPEVNEGKKEKRLTKLVGEVVVRSMSKYKEQMEHDTFKRYAKEVSDSRFVRLRDGKALMWGPAVHGDLGGQGEKGAFVRFFPPSEPVRGEEGEDEGVHKGILA